MHTIHAILQISVLAPHLAPRITSGDRYCRVWMSFVKCWFVQQAFPKSAILTDMIPISGNSSFSPDLSSVIPDISLAIASLMRFLLSVTYSAILNPIFENLRCSLSSCIAGFGIVALLGSGGRVQTAVLRHPCRTHEFAQRTLAVCFTSDRLSQ
jgi:hypothetical protein